ncbi:MAG: LacI family DNA-binding transcriptional regulator [Peptoniphilaceae bacterium]|nr:LacI family transcriptional regulator [Peptoniphilaceae bacterium]MDD7383548.1 LacI family DNA-binding transcriptional regulator [Peptoniphilaceae bacterium]MDY3738721.1 LacI family DNA-binding transcriptional regulator [Peptoniphilaceae bacterium]
MAQPTIKDVAKLAGVSISTVSRVMNNSKPVSPEAKRKVLDAIHKLDFKPNELARSLVMRKSNLIGVIVEDLGIEYMAQIIRGIEEIGRMYKYDILLSSTYGDEEIERRAVDFLASKQVEGIVIISEDISAEIIVKVKEYKIPFVLLDKFYSSKTTPTIRIDYEKEFYNMVKYLNNLGHENIALTIEKKKNVLSDQKYAGYKRAIDEIGSKEKLIDVDGIDSEAGYKIGQVVKKSIDEDKTTAIIGINDEVCIGLITYCYDNDISVPEDISIIGFGDFRIAKVFRPKLTTLQLPFYDLGAVAIRTLIKVLRKEEEFNKDYILKAQIIERESTTKI